MAATDAFYRDVKKLHVVFGVTSLLMLATVIAMFAEDYLREWKREQRVFRDVEAEVARRNILAITPGAEAVDKVAAAENAVNELRNELDKKKNELVRNNKALLSNKLKAENLKQAIKADYDSIMSFYNLAVEQNPEEGDASAAAKRFKIQLDELRTKLDAAQLEVEKYQAEYDQVVSDLGIDAVERKLKEAEKVHKELVSDFDRFVKLASQKRWSAFDSFRALPIIDGFASPTKIQQYTLDELPIDYSFKFVTRYDRCTTCHLGLEKTGYDKEILAKLTSDPTKDEGLMEKYRVASDILTKRKEQGAKGLPNPSELKPTNIPAKNLTAGRITAFASHPRLDLYVDGNSAHPGEKFGCTICHSGQGSATGFFDSSHFPNDSPTMERWRTDHGWAGNHFWDYPMLPTRFTESSCVKCHHQITDLIREGTQVEAPKLVKGYNLVRELGCFGCHEISGLKGGRKIGPDMRLEPEPPIESLSPAERAKALSDPLNPPGSMRKVGPSLNRLSEKTTEDWVRRWIKDPRGFRPDTRMPHFYGQANNNEEALAGTGQEEFPDTEIHAISYYLMRASAGQIERDKATIPPAASLNVPAVPTADADRKAQVDRGRTYFSEKGCLACHQHAGTTTDSKTADGKPLPGIVSESDFGPDLSRMAAKIRPDDTGRKWLVAWLLEPTRHSPRTRMPSVQLSPEEASDIVAWLLAQKELASKWKPVEVAAATTDSLKSMARLYLEKAFPRSVAKSVLDNGITDDQFKTLKIADDADERELSVPISDDKLKMYVGRKGIGNLGCYACHTIPGFQAAKPIGAALNEWGKKDVDRLAYEDADAFVKEKFHIVPRRDNPKDRSKPDKEWKNEGSKPPYEKYFADMLAHHGRKREGFLHLKLIEPRSYDYNRIKTWDDRARMPQFKFARVVRKANENDADFAARSSKEEAEAREAVMTFILGLVAEPIPAKYVHNPNPDRAAEVIGRQVLDKYNCAGCHILRPGRLEINATKKGVLDLWEKFAPEARPLEVPYTGGDHIFPEHSFWSGTTPKRADRLVAHVAATTAAKIEDEESGKEVDVVIARLGQALRFKNNEGKIRDVPAAGSFPVPPDAIVSRATNYGGTFASVLIDYLKKKDNETYGGAKENYAYSAAPPTLAHEGEKVQTDWLFQFLKQPKPLRPLAVLRMPKFNLSDAEATALVNYFAATNKVSNPGIGLTFPYAGVSQRDEEYLKRKTTEYVARLKKENQYEARRSEFAAYWKEATQRQLTEAQDRAKQANARLKAAMNDAEKADAQKAKTAAEADAKRLEDQVKSGNFTDQMKLWEEREAYIADAYRLVANGNLCLTCHKVGNIEPKGYQGPNLELSWDRLRPDFTQKWVANPQRFLHFQTVMPINFPGDKSDFKDIFAGSSSEQILATRDFLMLYPIVKDWSILKARPIIGMAPPAPPGGK